MLTCVARDYTEALLAAWEDGHSVDHHCHLLRRWPYHLKAEDLRAAFTEALDRELAHDHVVHTVAYQNAVRRLTDELQCEPTEAGVIHNRNASEPAAYARQLLTRTYTEIMLVDTGFASADTFTLDEQERTLGLKQREIIRLETIAEKLVKTSSDPQEWLDAMRQSLRAGIQRGAVGVKTICAYRASLKLNRVDKALLDVPFAALKSRADRGEPIRLTGDALCHALVFEAAAECAQLEVPLQVHCGFGDPDEDLANTSPLGLRPLFIDPAYRGLRVALLHCYPYHREAAYLCSVFPGAYMDLSLTIPFAGVDGVRAMKETLGLCPTSKLLYASDASRYPEVFFVAATLHREALAEALSELIDRNILTEQSAVVAGRQVLDENARRIYRLS
jgi:hypothetical protein